MSRSRDRPWFWAVGKCRPLSPRPLTWRVQTRATCKPPLRQVALRSERCAALSHLPVPLLSKSVGANSHRRPLSLLSTPWENCFARMPLATVRVTCCPRSRVALVAPPLENYGAHAELVKISLKLPPAEPFATGICARPNIANGSARMKDPSLPQAGLSLRMFSSSHCSCSRSSSKRLIVSTSDETSFGFCKNTSAPASRAAASTGLPARTTIGVSQRWSSSRA